jgi:hypothetical protein
MFPWNLSLTSWRSKNKPSKKPAWSRWSFVWIIRLWMKSSKVGLVTFRKNSNVIILFLFVKLTDCFAAFSPKWWIWRKSGLCHLSWCTSLPNSIPWTQRHEDQSLDLSDSCAFKSSKPINVGSFPWSLMERGAERLTATDRATVPGHSGVSFRTSRTQTPSVCCVC